MRVLPESRGALASGGALALFSCLVLAFPTGCHRPDASDAGISVESQVSPRPAKVGTANIALTLTASDGRPVTHAHISVEGDMTHPGMSPSFADAKETTPGRYQAMLDLTMGGDWVVLLHIKTADGRILERQIGLPSVQPN